MAQESLVTCSTSSKLLPHSYSAPVTPLGSSPTAQLPPRIKTNTLSWLSGIRVPQSGPMSPTFSLVVANPFGFGCGGSRMWTSGQSGTCSPGIPCGFYNNADILMAKVVFDEFAFGRVKPWEGEIIHEECGNDDIELTLGSSKIR